MRQLIAVMLVFTALLAGCGGGGSSSGGGGSSSGASVDYQPYAISAKLSATVSLISNTVTLNWTDSFPNGATYSVKAKNSDGSFSTIETLSGLGGTNTPMSWQRNATVSTDYKIDANINGKTITILTVKGNSQVSTNVPALPPIIVSDKAEPISGLAKLSLNSSVTYASVSWFANQRLIGGGATSAGNAIDWNTTLLPSGLITVLARMETSADAYLEVQRIIDIYHSNIRVATQIKGTSGTIPVYLVANSGDAISSVTLAIDSTNIGTQTIRNACYAPCNGVNNAFLFNIDGYALGSGSHIAHATARDTAGHEAQDDTSFTISNAPVVTLPTPQDGAFVSGSMTVTGSSSSDKPGPVNVTITLADQTVLQTSNPNFSTTYNLAGFGPGSYTLTTKAVDSTNVISVEQRTITVTSSAALIYTPLLTAGAAGDLLAAEGSQILYKSSDGTVKLRNTVTNTEIVMSQSVAVKYATDWQISGGRVFVSGQLSDCPVFACIYMWTSSGAIQNLTLGGPAPSIVQSDLHPVAKDGYVLWPRSSSAYVLYKISDASYQTIGVPAGADYIGNNANDFTVSGGVVTVFFWAVTQSNFNIYKWASDTGLSVALTNSNIDLYPQTDGVRVVWVHQPVQSPSSPIVQPQLWMQPVSGGATTVVATNAGTHFATREGVFSWEDSGKLYAQYNNAAAVNLGNGVPYDTAAGTLAYLIGNSQVYTWKASTGVSTLRIDSAPTKVIVTSGAMYFVNGTNKWIYKVPLN